AHIWWLMSNYGGPYEWGNAWDGTEFESIIDELIEKTDRNKEQLDKIQATLDSLESDHNALKNKIVGPLQYEFEAFKIDTIKTVEVYNCGKQLGGLGECCSINCIEKMEKLFRNKKLNVSVRIVKSGEEVLFYAKDVAESLGYSNPQKAIRDNVWKSNKATDWVFSEVLPSILVSYIRNNHPKAVIVPGLENPVGEYTGFAIEFKSPKGTDLSYLAKWKINLSKFKYQIAKERKKKLAEPNELLSNDMLAYKTHQRETKELKPEFIPKTVEVTKKADESKSSWYINGIKETIKRTVRYPRECKGNGEKRRAGYLFKMFDNNGYAKEAHRHNLAMENLTAEREKYLEEVTDRRNRIAQLKSELAEANKDINSTNKSLELVRRINELTHKPMPRMPQLSGVYREMEWLQMATPEEIAHSPDRDIIREQFRSIYIGTVRKYGELLELRRIQIAPDDKGKDLFEGERQFVDEVDRDMEVKKPRRLPLNYKGRRGIMPTWKYSDRQKVNEEIKRIENERNPKIKRPRGRPPKVKSDTEVKIPKKRGRPPKRKVQLHGDLEKPVPKPRTTKVVSAPKLRKPARVSREVKEQPIVVTPEEHEIDPFGTDLEKPFHRKIETAANGAAVTYSITPHYMDPLDQMTASRQVVRGILVNELKRMGGLKYTETIKVRMSKEIGNGKTKKDSVYFESKTGTVTNFEDIESTAAQNQLTILSRIETFQNLGSNWIILNIESHYVNIAMYKPLKGSSYIKLPVDISNPRCGLINMKNNDNLCFLWSHVRHLRPKVRRATTITQKDRDFITNLDYKGIDFPVKIMVIAKLCEQRGTQCLYLCHYDDKYSDYRNSNFKLQETAQYVVTILEIDSIQFMASSLEALFLDDISKLDTEGLP
ncbi:DNA polymerase, partial [Paramuricea clavata]